MPNVTFPETYSAKNLLIAFRFVKANPDAQITIGDGWKYGRMNGEQWMNWFYRCLNEKINATDPRKPTGRKAGDEYQTELFRLSRYVGNRIVVDWIAPILGERVKSAMSHRMRTRGE